MRGNPEYTTAMRDRARREHLVVVAYPDDSIGVVPRPPKDAKIIIDYRRKPS